MPLIVDIWEDEELLGYLLWTGPGEHIRSTQQGRDTLFNTIISLPIYAPEKDKEVTAFSDPGAFMRNLCAEYKSPYLRASEAREVPSTSVM